MDQSYDSDSFGPARDFQPLLGLKTTLREYQRFGVEWLAFLFDNGFGGLLCDEMGLGKTHQALALMLVLREQRGIKASFLVVCPTTVLSHWKRLIQLFVPGLKAKIFHSSGRDLEDTLDECDVLITTYGILRIDVEKLAQYSFAVAIFDEIQFAKNPETLIHKAAQRINAQMRLGLTGTPIENKLDELWALFNLVFPGYLGPLNDSFNVLVGVNFTIKHP